MNWVEGSIEESPFGTPTKAEVEDYDKALEAHNQEESRENIYLRYFQEEFEVWKNFFQKKEEERIFEEAETPKKEKPKSEAGKNGEIE